MTMGKYPEIAILPLLHVMEVPLATLYPVMRVYVPSEKLSCSPVLKSRAGSAPDANEICHDQGLTIRYSVGDISRCTVETHDGV